MFKATYDVTDADLQAVQNMQAQLRRLGVQADLRRQDALVLLDVLCAHAKYVQFVQQYAAVAKLQVYNSFAPVQADLLPVPAAGASFAQYVQALTLCVNADTPTAQRVFYVLLYAQLYNVLPADLVQTRMQTPAGAYLLDLLQQFVRLAASLDSADSVQQALVSAYLQQLSAFAAGA